MWWYVVAVALIGLTLITLLLFDLRSFWEADVAAQRGADGPDDNAPTCSQPAAEPITVWTSPMVKGTISTLLDRVHNCGTYKVAAFTSSEAVRRLGVGQAPDVWVPDSDLWIKAAENSGIKVKKEAIAATSPVILVAPQQFGQRYLKERNLGLSSSWADILAAGDFPLRVADPSGDPASLAMVSAVERVLADEAGLSRQRDAMVFNLAQSVLAARPFETIRSGTDSFVPVAEQALTFTNRKNLPLTVLIPTEGAGNLTFPVLTFGRSDGPVQAITQSMTDPWAAQVWHEAGLRPGKDGPAPGGTGVSDSIASVPSGKPEQVDALLQMWERALHHPQMTMLVDVSGSMDTIVGPMGESRREITVEAILAAVREFSVRSRVGMRVFSSNRVAGGQDWLEVVPLRSLDDKINGATQLYSLLKFTSTIDENFTGGNTGLYDSVVDGYRDVSRAYDGDYNNSLVVLTDGANDDDTGGLSESEAVERLKRLRNDKKPVELVLLGIGSEVQGAPMERMAQAAGGRYLQINNEADMKSVLVNLVVERDQR